MSLNDVGVNTETAISLSQSHYCGMTLRHCITYEYFRETGSQILALGRAFAGKPYAEFVINSFNTSRFASNVLIGNFLSIVQLHNKPFIALTH